MPIPKKIALDIGSVRIGVAISDALGFLAHPYCTLKWKSIEKLIKNVQKIIEDEQIDTLIVGLPYTLKGTKSEQTKNIIKIIEQLREHISIPIETIDERLTTKLAETMLQQSGKQASKNRDIIDQIAAVNILQTYLDKVRNK